MKLTKKRFSILTALLLLVVAISLVLVACGDKETPPPSEEPVDTLPVSPEEVSHIEVVEGTIPTYYPLNGELDLSKAKIAVYKKAVELPPADETPEEGGEENGEGEVAEAEDTENPADFVLVDVTADMVSGFSSTKSGKGFLTITYAEGIFTDYEYTVFGKNLYVVTYHLNGGTYPTTGEEDEESASAKDTQTYPQLLEANENHVIYLYKNDVDIDLYQCSKAGYTFQGWHKAEDFSDEAITTVDEGNVDFIHLYANWSLNENVINFHSSFEGEEEVEFQITYTYFDSILLDCAQNEALAELVNPIIEKATEKNLVFVGFYASDTFSGNPLTEIDVTKAEDVDVYLRWTEKVTVSLKHNPASTYVYPLNLTNARVLAEERLVIKNVEGEVIEDDVKILATNIPDFDTTVAGEKEINILYTRDGYVHQIPFAYTVLDESKAGVFYNPMDGQFNPEDTLFHSYDFAEGIASESVLPVPVKENYTFIGWTKVTSATAKPTANSKPLVAVPADPETGAESIPALADESKNPGTLYLCALWTPTVYKIHYMSLQDGAEYEEIHTEEYTVETVVKEGKETLEYLPLWAEATRTNFYFKGWRYGSESGDFVENQPCGLSGDKYYYADWYSTIVDLTINPLKDDAYRFDVSADSEGLVLSSTITLADRLSPLREDSARIVYVLVGENNVELETYELHTGAPFTAKDGTEIKNVIWDDLFTAKSFGDGFVTIQAIALNDEASPESWTYSAEYKVDINVPYVQVLSIDADSNFLFIGASQTLTCKIDPISAKDLQGNITFQVSVYTSPTALPAVYDNFVTPSDDDAEKYEILITDTQKVPEGSVLYVQAFLNKEFNPNGKTVISEKFKFTVPKAISSYTELAEMKKDGNYYLSADIDFAGNSWIPFGYAEEKDGELTFDNAFTGSFFGYEIENGQKVYHVIENFTLDLAGHEQICAGFFGATSHATVEGVTLENVSISGDCATVPYVGAIAGLFRNGSMKDCTVLGEINLTNATHVGGLVGYMFSSVHDSTNVKNTDGLTITVENGEDAADTIYVGGIVGLQENGEVSGIVSKANITVNGAKNAYVGGIAGNAQDGFNNCEAYGSITVNALHANVPTETTLSVGGIAGEVSHKTDNLAKVTELKAHDINITVSATGKAYVGGIAGNGTDVEIYLCESKNLTLTVGMGGTITKPATKKNTLYVGGIAGNGASIGSCKVENGKITVNNMSDLYAGGIAGTAKEIVDGIVDCGIKADNIFAELSVGGIAGIATGSVNGTYDHVSNTTENPDIQITTSSASIHYVGGLLGQGTVITQSTVTADISLLCDEAKTADIYLGGIVGSATSCEKTTYQGSLTVKGSKAFYVGGIIGKGESVTEASATVVLNLTGGKGTSTLVGGIAGYISSAITNSQAKANLGATSQGAGVLNMGGIAGQVKSANKDLAILSDNTVLEGSTLTGSSDQGATVSIGGIAGLANGEFGYNVATAKISASSISTSGKGSVYAGGAFGQIEKGSSAYCTTVINGQVDGSASENVVVGGVVGQNSATIAISYAYGGTVNANLTTAGKVGNAGGFVGKNVGSVDECYASVRVAGNIAVVGNIYLGGFAGANNATILRSYTQETAYLSDVVGEKTAGEMYVGGFVGSNEAPTTSATCLIEDCYSLSRTDAASYVGGFVGINGSTATIARSIARGSVNDNTSGSGSAVNGFAGKGTTGYVACINHCYSDEAGTIPAGTKQSNQAGGSSSVEGISNYSTYKMKNSSTYVKVMLGYSDQVWTFVQDENPSLIFSDSWVLSEDETHFEIAPKIQEE